MGRRVNRRARLLRDCSLDDGDPLPANRDQLVQRQIENLTRANTDTIGASVRSAPHRWQPVAAWALAPRLADVPASFQDDLIRSGPEADGARDHDRGLVLTGVNVRRHQGTCREGMLHDGDLAPGPGQCTRHRCRTRRARHQACLG